MTRYRPSRRSHIYSLFKLTIYTIAVLLSLCWINQFLTEDRRMKGIFYYKKDVLDEIDIDCNSSQWDDIAVHNLKRWKFNTSDIEEQLLQATEKCEKIRELLYFPSEPLSKEEEEYPLAYGMLVHKDIVQVLMMLSSFYHPQNLYCISVSETADSLFRQVISSLPNCFANIHVMIRPPIKWGSFEIINSTYACFDYLTRSQNDWKYYQYLSGVDVPLKTNLEMVRILKILNKTVNLGVFQFQTARLNGNKLEDAPLPLFKTSLSALIPRETARDIVNSNESQAVLKYISRTKIADESFWGTMIFNSEVFNISGSLSGTELLREIEKIKKTIPKGLKYIPETLKKQNYISRLQYWQNSPCKGKMVKASCVFGVEDVPHIIRQPQLVAHKLYFDYQPAAPICIFKEIRRRSRNPEEFDTSFYRELPYVEMKRGVRLQNVTHPDWLIDF